MNLNKNLKTTITVFYLASIIPISFESSIKFSKFHRRSSTQSHFLNQKLLASKKKHVLA